MLNRNTVSKFAFLPPSRNGWKMKNQWRTLRPNSALHAALRSDRWRRYELISSPCSDSLLPTTLVLKVTSLIFLFKFKKFKNLSHPWTDLYRYWTFFCAVQSGKKMPWKNWVFQSWFIWLEAHPSDFYIQIIPFICCLINIRMPMQLNCAMLSLILLSSCFLAVYFLHLLCLSTSCRVLSASDSQLVPAAFKMWSQPAFLSSLTRNWRGARGWALFVFSN